MILTYSGRSRLGAEAIASVSNDIRLNRGSRGDINWGRANANTQLNPDTSNVTNKRRMRELFKEHDVPMPKLISMDEIRRIGYGFMGRRLVGRPDTHMKGRGFWICDTYGDIQRALRGTRRKRAATHFMEYIDAPREYRVHIFLGKSIRISEKVFDRTGNYTTGKPEHSVRHVRRAAKKAVEAVGLDFGAVDVLADDNQAWVLEVNSAPGLGGSMPRVYADAFQRWYEGEWDE